MEEIHEYPKCSFTEDEIEIKTHAIRSAVSNIVLESSNALKEAFESQNRISDKIIELDACLEQLDALKKSPNYKSSITKINSMRGRVQKMQKRIKNLQARFNALEQTIRTK
ncbi:hypothetical protein TRFO_36991 [Tritrichomonas foetus]|uniref:Biogenesis of lysosome-related organelles complex 1 subunit 7 n=1 Tax=Tritrichomonas foetus TaxID=1144522 RepID=A0A1J4JGK3_9EUKA|nr:hypothetical protein TRFO_36991 [Tritrichomonas foetus]|eukprot:OHS96771.1 hypothetical protein TRFO_36991 [Tritrichomonas foetus]